jgi:hypothetical protein
MFKSKGSYIEISCGEDYYVNCGAPSQLLGALTPGSTFLRAVSLNSTHVSPRIKDTFFEERDVRGGRACCGA